MSFHDVDSLCENRIANDDNDVWITGISKKISKNKFIVTIHKFVSEDIRTLAKF